MKFMVIKNLNYMFKNVKSVTILSKNTVNTNCRINEMLQIL